MKRAGLLALALAAGLATGLAGAPASAADKVSIAVTTGSTTNGIFWIAKAKGYFAAENLDVDLVNFDPPQLGIAAVVNGQIDLYGTTLNASIYNTAGAGDITLISGLARERAGYRGTAFVTSVKAYDEGFKSVKDFAGKKVGVGQLGSSQQYCVVLAGRKYGFPTPPGNFVPLGSVGNIIGALSAGSVGAAMLPGATAVGAEAQGQIKIVAWVGDEVPHASHGIFVGRKALTEKREILVRVMKVLLKTAALYDEAFQKKGADGKPAPGANAVEFVEIIAAGSKLQPDAVRRSLPFIDPALPLSVDEMAVNMKNWQELNMVDASATAAKAVDLSVLQAASR